MISIEPDEVLFSRASESFSANPDVTIIHGTSEEVLPALLTEIYGDVNFWLDGHFSGNGTFKGSQVTPIVTELQQIEKHFERFNKVCIFVDDVRCFVREASHSEGYPPLGHLVSWAEDRYMWWTIEHDIFIAKNKQGDPWRESDPSDLSGVGAV